MANLTLLKHKNPHERDENITFEPIAHKYTICGGHHSFVSVTTWLHSHFEPFDADAIITRMMTSSKWSASPYYGKTREDIKMGWEKNRDEAASAGTNLHYEIEMFYAGDTPQPPITASNPATSSAIVEDKIVGGDAHPLPLPKPPTASGIAATASAIVGGDAPKPPTASGIAATASAIVGGDAPKPPTASGIAATASAIAYFMNYVATHAAHFIPYRTEWMVYDEEVRIAGSIDMVYEDPAGDGSLMIYDWKRTKEIKKTDSFNKFSTTECINHLPDTNFWHYALQLNIYKAIIERNYGKKVTTLMLVCLHPDNKNKDYLLFKVPDLHEEVRDLFELRKKQISIR
jgi:hypothetical protein